MKWMSVDVIPWAGIGWATLLAMAACVVLLLESWRLSAARRRDRTRRTVRPHWRHTPDRQRPPGPLPAGPLHPARRLALFSFGKLDDHATVEIVTSTRMPFAPLNTIQVEAKFHCPCWQTTRVLTDPVSLPLMHMHRCAVCDRPLQELHEMIQIATDHHEQTLGLLVARN